VDTELVRRVARGLRYRPLGQLVGRTVLVRDLDAIEEAVRVGLGDEFPVACRLDGPELVYRHGAVAKYGILDLRFSVLTDLLVGAASGVPLLRELGFLPGESEQPLPVCDDPVCLEMLAEEVAAGHVFVNLFLEGGRPEAAPGGSERLRVPEGYLPRSFRVVDACVTNAASVWLWKHFYL
jgi:hypothetical protein